MTIRTCTENEVKLYEVYLNGLNSRGQRIQRKRTGIETRRKAETIEFELKRELAKLRDEAVPYKWSEWYQECLRRMRILYRPSTLKTYEGQIAKWITPIWQDTPLHEITTSRVHDTIFEKLAPGLSPASKKNILKMTKRIFQMAVESGILDRNPCVGLKVKVPEPDQKVLTNSEADHFLSEALACGHRFYPMRAAALMTGMRSGELFALKWSDLDFDAGIISVSRQWSDKNGITSTKTGKSRVVPMSDDLATFLKELKLKRGNSSEFVLENLPEWMNGEQARVTREFCEAIGITPVKFHDLRVQPLLQTCFLGAYHWQEPCLLLVTAN